MFVRFGDAVFPDLVGAIHESPAANNDNRTKNRRMKMQFSPRLSPRESWRRMATERATFDLSVGVEAVFSNLVGDGAFDVP